MPSPAATLTSKSRPARTPWAWRAQRRKGPRLRRALPRAIMHQTHQQAAPSRLSRQGLSQLQNSRHVYSHACRYAPGRAHELACINAYSHVRARSRVSAIRSETSAAVGMATTSECTRCNGRPACMRADTCTATCTRICACMRICTCTGSPNPAPIGLARACSPPRRQQPAQ